MQSFTGANRMDFETPPAGISLTGYINRRLQKTSLLSDIPAQIETQPAAALAQFAIYAAASATSWGPARYQPRFDKPGTVITETDSETGATVIVEQLPRNPHYAFACQVEMPDGSSVTGQESITRTTVGLHGLGMPAPSHYDYQSAGGEYTAKAVGVINSELAPRILRPWQIRGYGSLQLSDNLGQTGQLHLDRKGQIEVDIMSPDQKTHTFHFDLK